MNSKAAPHPDIKDLARRAVGPLHQVWGQIASDCYEAASCCGESVTKEMEIESSMDANRLSSMYPQYKDLEDEIYGLNAADSKKLDRELMRIW